ncbi:hypothetical protein ALC56_08483 [Trachymyrmex septentrionalis]|uniref:Uncharacterized protein n=1 Tax=Trachymyrmex septentrionalis TaxID=34720 RepID=A0A195F911_9HYME|nr:hypothetical protein ALC56_08483 [Trachymyrmex septentrionalis]
MHSAEIETARAALEMSERLVSHHYERSPGAQRLSREWFRVETLETSELMSRCYATPRSYVTSKRGCRDVILEAISKVDEATFIAVGFEINVLDDTADMFRVVNIAVLSRLGTPAVIRVARLQYHYNNCAIIGEALKLLFYPDESENSLETSDMYDFDFEDSNDSDSDCD